VELVTNGFETWNSDQHSFRLALMVSPTLALELSGQCPVISSIGPGVITGPEDSS